MSLNVVVDTDVSCCLDLCEKHKTTRTTKFLQTGTAEKRNLAPAKQTKEAKNIHPLALQGKVKPWLQTAHIWKAHLCWPSSRWYPSTDCQPYNKTFLASSGSHTLDHNRKLSTPLSPMRNRISVACVESFNQDRFLNQQSTSIEKILEGNYQSGLWHSARKSESMQRDARYRSRWTWWPVFTWLGLVMTSFLFRSAEWT